MVEGSISGVPRSGENKTHYNNAGPECTFSDNSATAAELRTLIIGRGPGCG
jgi:hypothetical protein